MGEGRWKGSQGRGGPAAEVCRGGPALEGMSGHYRQCSPQRRRSSGSPLPLTLAAVFPSSPACCVFSLALPDHTHKSSGQLAWFSVISRSGRRCKSSRLCTVSASLN